MTLKHNYSGKSLLELREQYGTGSSGFYDNSWWLSESFASEKPKAGLYELDLSNKLNNLTFEEQKKKLKKGFKVAHPAIVAEAILEHFKKTDKRIAESYWLRTSVVDSYGHRVDVGNFDSDGLGVSDVWVDHRYSDLGVSSARKLKSGKVDALETLPKELMINGVKYIREI